MSVVLRRSLLYVPGSSDEMMKKAGARGADVLILDLEDGVHPDAKEAARVRIEGSIDGLDLGGAEVLVRVNGVSSPWGAGDLEMVERVRPAGCVVPKVEEPTTVGEVDRRLAESVPLYLMIETARGVLASAQLALSSPRVTGLVFGAADFRESLRAGKHPEELEIHFARSQILLSARAAGIEAYDTPWFEYQDLEGLGRSARRARWMGFDGKTAIHPQQVGIINEVFSPVAAEVVRAQKIVTAMETALRNGRYVATVDGEMVEALHLREARRTLSRAEALGMIEPEGKGRGSGGRTLS